VGLALRIGELAAATGVQVETLRFYEQEQLLMGLPRFGGQVSGLRAMDVSLAELVRILEVRRAGVCNCSALKESIASKLISIDARIDELAAMKTELARLLASWQECGGTKSGSADAGHDEP
jgi:DNA-binding transcriptional MerR regulator